jgi:hypothetical protein
MGSILAALIGIAIGFSPLGNSRLLRIIVAAARGG